MNPTEVLELFFQCPDDQPREHPLLRARPVPCTHAPAPRALPFPHSPQDKILTRLRHKENVRAQDRMGAACPGRLLPIPVFLSGTEVPSYPELEHRGLNSIFQSLPTDLWAVPCHDRQDG